MKPTCQFAKNQFPSTDCFFRASTAHGRYSSPDDDHRWNFRTFHSLQRQFLVECARERLREMVVFALIVVAAAWPVIYMIVTVVKLLSKGRPLDH